MKMSKKRAEELLEVVTQNLKEAYLNLEVAKDTMDTWKCAKTYLEFIMHGLKRNPSLKKDEEAEG
jgi:hypothetical protein